MSLSKINSEVERLKHKILDRHCQRNNRKIIILSDSKGRYLRNQACKGNTRNIHFVYRKGATISNQKLVQQVIRNAKFELNPIILVWFGTCDFTVKTGKEIRVAESSECTERVVEKIIARYRELKRQILFVNKSANVFFVECPPISTKRWAERTSGNGDEFIKQDEKLAILIQVFNTKLCELNLGIKVPKITQDLIRSSKQKHFKTRYKVNWNLYSDGIHPCDVLAELWLYRLYYFATNLGC